MQHVLSGKELTFRPREPWVKRGADFRAWRRGAQAARASEELMLDLADQLPFKYEFKFVTGRSVGAGTDSPVVVSVWGGDGAQHRRSKLSRVAHFVSSSATLRLLQPPLISPHNCP